MRVTLALALAGLLAASSAQAQTAAAIEEGERWMSTGNQLAAQRREEAQRYIDRTTRAMQEGDYQKAARLAQALTRKDPDRVEAWLLLGSAHMGAGDWPKAQKAYGRAVRIWPINAEARTGLAVAYARSGDPRAATHLAWISGKVSDCAGRCPDALRLAGFKSEVEKALAQAPPVAPKGS